MKHKALNKIRERRKNRVRAKINGTAERPRLSVFRSNRNMFLQLINDQEGKTLVSVSTGEFKDATKKKTKTSQAEAAAAALFKKMKGMEINKIVFDRGLYKYHGRVKAVAEALRKEGLKL